MSSIPKSNHSPRRCYRKRGRPPHRTREEECGTSCDATAEVTEASGRPIPEPIDVDAFDDDVILSSPRSFAKAKVNSKRIRNSRTVVSLDLERSSSSTSKRSRPEHGDSHINLEYSNRVKPDVAFKCPICMGPIVEETSTICGHIFCKECIKSALAVQSKCPTCRKKVVAKKLIRIFLPAVN